MHANDIQRKKWNAKLISIILTAALITSFGIIQLGATLAAPQDIVVNLECESGISAGSHIEVGAAKSLSTTYLFEAYSTKPDVAEVTFIPGTGIGNIKTTGLKAGIAGIAYGTENGTINTMLYQITDQKNVSAYSIKDGGELYFTGPGERKSSPVEVKTGSFDRIKWRSMNEAVASVDKNGDITSTGIGATIIIGSFTDKWGVPRDMHILTGVGIKYSDSGAGNLLGPDKDGNYYKPVEDPKNVFEVVDKNGEGKVPPEYVYNPDGDPVDKSDNNRPAKENDGSFYVEDPEGSNNYKEVNSDGTLKDINAIPGLDKTPDGGTIVIDGKEWTKVKTDVTGKCALLVLDELLPIGAVQYDSRNGFNYEYPSADIKAKVDNWYAGLNAPILKKFAWTTNISSNDYESWPTNKLDSAGTFAFIAKRADLMSLSVAKRGLGQDYWTATKTTFNDAVGYQVTVNSAGDWGMKGVTQTQYVRPAIWVTLG